MFDIHRPDQKERKACEQNIFIQNAKSILLQNGIYEEKHQKAIAKALLELYSSEDKYYHTYIHINYMIENMKRYCGQMSASECLAILFHDIICLPGQKDNEGRSIDFMIMLMAGYGVPITKWCWASRCIRESAHHLQEVHDPSTHAFLDLDLSHFAAPYVDFESSCDLVIKEYNRSKEENKAFLSQFLEKEKIYYQLTNLENCARANFRRYLSKK